MRATHPSLSRLAVCIFVGMARLKIRENERLIDSEPTKSFFSTIQSMHIISSFWLKYAFGQSNCFIILWSSISLQGISEYLRFFSWRYSSLKRNFWGYCFWLGVVSNAQACQDMPEVYLGDVRYTGRFR